MANSKIVNIQSDIKVNSPNVESKNIPKSFTSEDTVEIHIFDLQDNKLLSLNNTFISPHIANASIDSLDIQIKVFINNLVKYKNNQPLNNIIT